MKSINDVCVNWIDVDSLVRDMFFPEHREVIVKAEERIYTPLISNIRDQVNEPIL